tara:strand:+ start:5825 stop:6043 length:219 start_codon:yes stop_codon:yes gene_type:complete
MSKLFAVLFSALIWGQAYACPMCAGSKTSEADQNLVYILMIFIGLIYIPFFIIYRTIIKNRNPNIPADSENK